MQKRELNFKDDSDEFRKKALYNSEHNKYQEREKIKNLIEEDLFKLKYNDMLYSFNPYIKDILENHLKEYIQFHGIPNEKEYNILVKKLIEYKLLNSFIWFVDNVETSYEKYYFIDTSVSDPNFRKKIGYVPFYLYGLQKGIYSNNLQEFEYEENTEQDLITLFTYPGLIYNSINYLILFRYLISVNYINLIKLLLNKILNQDNSKNYIIIYCGILESIIYNNIETLQLFLDNYVNKININTDFTERHLIIDFLNSELYYNENNEILKINIYDLIGYLIFDNENLESLNKMKPILNYIFIYTTLLNNEQRKEIEYSFKYKIVLLLKQSIKNQPIFAEPYFTNLISYNIKDVEFINSTLQEGICNIYVIINDIKYKIHVDIQCNFNRDDLILYLKHFLTKINIYNNLLYLMEDFTQFSEKDFSFGKIYITSLERIVRFYEFNNGRFALITLYPNSQDQELNKIIMLYHS